MRSNLCASRRDSRRMGNAVMPVMTLLVAGIVWLHVAIARRLLRPFLATARRRAVLAVLLCLGFAMYELRSSAPDEAAVADEGQAAPWASEPMPRLCDGGRPSLATNDGARELPRAARRRTRAR